MNFENWKSKVKNTGIRGNLLSVGSAVIVK